MRNVKFSKRYVDILICIWYNCHTVYNRILTWFCVVYSFLLFVKIDENVSWGVTGTQLKGALLSYFESLSPPLGRTLWREKTSLRNASSSPQPAKRIPEPPTKYLCATTFISMDRASNKCAKLYETCCIKAGCICLFFWINNRIILIGTLFYWIQLKLT